MKRAAPKASRASPQTLVRLFSQLAIAARAQLPLADAMQIIAQDLDADESSAAMIAEVAAKVRGGGSLSDALQRSGGDFAPETIALVRAGEEAGTLVQVLEMLARDYEHRARFRTATRAAVAWPALSFTVFVVILLIVSFFAVPHFETMFRDFGATLPGPTRLLLAVSRVIREGWFVWLPLLALAIVLRSRLASRWEWYRSRLDDLAMSAPVVRTYMTRTLVSRLASVLSAVTAGAPLRESLAHLRATLSNRRLAARLASLEARLDQGETLAAAMAASGELPARLRVAVELGEKTGRLGAALQQTQELADEETERSLMRLEQATLVVAYLIVAVFVGLLVFAMYLPIFKLGSVI